MSALQEVLQRYAEEAPAALAGGRGRGVLAEDRDQLRRDLLEVSRGNARYFAVCLSLVVALLVAAILIVVFNIGNPAAIKTTLSACGLSAAGLLAWAVRIAKAKQAAEMLAVLAAHVDGPTMKTIVTVLVRQLGAK